MTKQVTIKIPTTEDIREVTGEVMLLQVGTRRIKFLVHKDPLLPQHYLTHYASGMRVGGALQLISIALYQSYKKPSLRSLAKKRLAEIENRAGLATMLDKFDNAPKLN